MRIREALALVALLHGSQAWAAEVELHSAWVRALPPVKKVTAAYVTIVNRGNDTALVVGGRASIAGAVEIHRTREVDGLMRMERLDSLAVPAGGSVELAPGGAHLMLFGLDHMPQPPEEVELCLELSSGETVCTVAATHKDAPDGDRHDHH